jgi:hypothetical protein
VTKIKQRRTMAAAGGSRGKAKQISARGNVARTA